MVPTGRVGLQKQSQMCHKEAVISVAKLSTVINMRVGDAGLPTVTDQNLVHSLSCQSIIAIPSPVVYMLPWEP